MKRNPKPFSVEIKKSRVPGQRNHLPPKPLFATALAQATMISRKDEPEEASKHSAAPRILPSIIEAVRSSSETVVPVRRRSTSVQAVWEQMALNLDASGFEPVKDGHTEAPAIAKAL